MRIVAILASYNEELFIETCLDHFISQGVEVYLIDNQSTDATVDLAQSYLNRGLIKIETQPRRGMYSWRPLLQRKEEVADEIKSDWYIHADPDEIRLPPNSNTTLVRALEEVEREGYNAVNFRTFLFLPTIESPDHEHPNFRETMRWYRYMEPTYPFQVKAWKRQKRTRARPSIELAGSGGHHVSFEGLRLCPIDFKMRHYPVLSLQHAMRKYVDKIYDPSEVKLGWHGWKAVAEKHNLHLPSEKEMRYYTNDDELDTSDPLKQTLIYQM